MEEGFTCLRAVVFDLLDGEVGVGGDADGVWSHVDDDHYGAGDEAFEKVVDFLV